MWRGVYASLVDHPDYRVLTPNARHALLTMRVGSLNTIASIFRLHAQALEEQTGLPSEAVEAALHELEIKPSAKRPWILRDQRNGVVWIRNGLRFDPNVTLSNSNHAKAVRRAVAALPLSSPVVRKFMRLHKELNLHSPQRSPTSGDTGGEAGSGSSTPTPSPNPSTKTPKTERGIGGEVGSQLPTPAPSPSLAGASFGAGGNGDRSKTREAELCDDLVHRRRLEATLVKANPGWTAAQIRAKAQELIEAEAGR